eukprot:SAG31_NODE_43842_length_265_cov_0.861446_1_plen_58_part_10
MRLARDDDDVTVPCLLNIWSHGGEVGHRVDSPTCHEQVKPIRELAAGRRARRRVQICI